MSQCSWPVGGEYDDRRLSGADRAIRYDFEDVEISVWFGFDDCFEQAVKPMQTRQSRIQDGDVFEDGGEKWGDERREMIDHKVL